MFGLHLGKKTTSQSDLWRFFLGFWTCMAQISEATGRVCTTYALETSNMMYFNIY